MRRRGGLGDGTGVTAPVRVCAAVCVDQKQSQVNILDLYRTLLVQYVLRYVWYLEVYGLRIGRKPSSLHLGLFCGVGLVWFSG